MDKLSTLLIRQTRELQTWTAVLGKYLVSQSYFTVIANYVDMKQGVVNTAIYRKMTIDIYSNEAFFYFYKGFDGYVPVDPRVNQIDGDDIEKTISRITTDQDVNSENERRREQEERQEQERRRQEEEERQRQERLDEEKRRQDQINEIEPDEDPVITTTQATETTPRPTRRRPIQENKVEPICKLPVEPEVDVDFDSGYRFGKILIFVLLNCLLNK